MIRARHTSAMALVAMMLCVFVEVLWPLAGLRLAARVLLAVYLMLEWPALAGNARAILAVALVMTVAYVVLFDTPLAALTKAADTAVFFAAFFANQFFLREAARTSPLVRRCASFFVDQPPSKRYALLTVGGYLFGIIVNLGVLSLLGQMIAKYNTVQAANGNAEIHHWRQRRMGTALLRGFSVTPLASPLSLSLAVVLTALPGLAWSVMALSGFACGMALLSLGWLFDRLGAPRHLSGLAGAPAVRHDYRSLLGVVAIVLCVLAMAKGLEHFADASPSRAILLAVPAIGMVWLSWGYVRRVPHMAGPLILRRVRDRATISFPAFRSEVAVLSGAGFAGTLFSAFVPPDLLSAVLTSHLLPTPLLPPALLLMVVGCGLVGINPIVLATIGAASLGAVHDADLPMEMCALALMAGWALAINSSALTASAMLLADVLKLPSPRRLMTWNAAYSATATLLLAVLLALASL